MTYVCCGHRIKKVHMEIQNLGSRMNHEASSSAPPPVIAFDFDP